MSPSAAGTGTAGRLAKWTETGGLGTLADSVVAESPSTGFLGIGTGMTAPVSALELAGSGANGSGGITLGTGAVAKSVYQVIKVGSEIISFFGGNVFVDGSLVTQRFNTSQVGWAAALDARASQDLFKLERLSAAGVTTRPAIIRGDGSFGFGNMTSPPNLTGAKFMMDSAGNVGVGTTVPLARLDVRGDLFVGLPSVPVDVSTAQNALYVANDSGDSRNHFRIDGFANNLAIVAHSGTGSPAGASISLRTGIAGGLDTDRVTIDPSGKVSEGHLLRQLWRNRIRWKLHRRCQCHWNNFHWWPSNGRI